MRCSYILRSIKHHRHPIQRRLGLQSHSLFCNTRGRNYKHWCSHGLVDEGSRTDRLIRLCLIRQEQGFRQIMKLFTITLRPHYTGKLICRVHYRYSYMPMTRSSNNAAEKFTERSLVDFIVNHSNPAFEQFKETVLEKTREFTTAGAASSSPSDFGKKRSSIP